jgi:hypothetical protein
LTQLPFLKLMCEIALKRHFARQIRNLMCQWRDQSAMIVSDHGTQYSKSFHPEPIVQFLSVSQVVRHFFDFGMNSSCSLRLPHSQFSGQFARRSLARERTPLSLAHMLLNTRPAPARVRPLWRKSCLGRYAYLVTSFELTAIRSHSPNDQFRSSFL